MNEINNFCKSYSFLLSYLSSLILLNVQVYLSHFSALIFLSFLVLFSGWLTSKRNYVIILYTISFLLASVSLIISLIYLDSYFSISGLPDNCYSEREKLVIDLYKNQNKSIREIAKMTKMSFRDIGYILKT